MSTLTSSSDDLSNRISKIETEVNQLMASINRAKRLRWIFLLSLLAIIIAIVVAFVSLAKRVTSKEYINEIGALAQKHYDENQTLYMEQLKHLSDKASPLVANAFKDQITKDLPKLTQSINSERDIFITNIQSKMDEQLSKQYNELLSRHEKIIVSNFPELENQKTRDRVVASLQLILERIITRNFGDQFRQRANELVAIWDSFPAAEKPQGDEMPLEQKLLTNLLFVASNAMTSIEAASESSNLPATAAPKLPNPSADTIGSDPSDL